MPSAAKALRKLDRPIARRLVASIKKLSDEPRPPGCVQLRGGSGELRIRVGDYRVIYEIFGSELVELVLHLGHRREVYR
ncbi:type II toxin-antitoxin system RelE family toxin [Brevibacterium siliguriense]|uniref:type II toxin-antitoxin system RelE family toxin n=1 Tax=Brevibacterium siliguriense TaxID=1136497 RepID=UPI001E59BDF0|nr:type II toxin-antitoxin system RelE/ParE family toxin [Brevibacterium siliguriense]